MFADQSLLSDSAKFVSPNLSLSEKKKELHGPNVYFQIVSQFSLREIRFLKKINLINHIGKLSKETSKYSNIYKKNFRLVSSLECVQFPLSKQVAQISYVTSVTLIHICYKLTYLPIILCIPV